MKRRHFTFHSPAGRQRELAAKGKVIYVQRENRSTQKYQCDAQLWSGLALPRGAQVQITHLVVSEGPASSAPAGRDRRQSRAT